MKDLDRKDPRKVIPHGPYCYSGTRNPADNNYIPCPYWELRGTIEEHYGCCSYLDISDDDHESFSHLWDQVKECGINNEYKD